MLAEGSTVKPFQLGKIPGRYAGGQWWGLGGHWPTVGLSKADQTKAQSWPTANVGLRAAEFPAIDCDVQSEEAFQVVDAVVSRMMGFAPIRKRANAPRALYVFKRNGDDAVRKMRLVFSDGVADHAVEVLGAGQQYVISGTHPSGVLYNWMEGRELVKVGADGLTPHDATAFARFMDALRQEVEGRGWVVKSQTQARAVSGGVEFPVTTMDPVIEPKLVLAALNAIPNTEENYPDRQPFVAICASFKAALGRDAEQHKEAFYGWATKHGWANPEWIDNIWDSITSTRVGPEHLFKEARKFGFIGDALADFSGEVPDIPKATNTPPTERSGRGGLANLNTIAQKLGETSEWQGVFGYDEFAQCEMVLGHLPNPERPNYRSNEPFAPRPLLDSDVTQTRLWLQRHGGMPSAKSSDVQDAIGWRARCNPFHPVRDWVGGLEWDGVPRLHSWLADHLGARADVPAELEGLYLSEVGTRFMIGAVARVFEPGCKLDTVLVLEGEQGIGKSSVVRALVPNGDWHSETPPELGTKDAALHLQGKWVIELSELASVNRAGQEHVKSFVTATVDKFRRPYGRKDESYPRQCVFVGTTNAQEFLRDDTGGRRFLPVRMTKPFDRRAFLAVRDQLWAEAKAAYQKGERWHITGRALDAAKEAQAAKAETDPWDTKVVAYAWELAREGRTPPTATAILTHGLNINLANQKKGDQMRVCGSLARAGWVKKQQRINGVPMKFWWHPELSDPPLAAWGEAQRRAEPAPGERTDTGCEKWSG